MLEMTLAAGLVLYGLLSLAWIATVWPIMRERDRKRKEQYKRLLDATMVLFAHRLQEAETPMSQSSK